jgi:glucokinase
MARSSDEHFSFPILIGDIGGTNARFSIITDQHTTPRDFPIIQTANYATIDEAIQAGVLDKTSVQPVSAILAVAGPIRGDEIPLTNCPWVVKPLDMLANLGLSDVMIVNDFEAQALAIASLGDEDQIQIGRGESLQGHSKVVLGPGTGLGVAGLVHARHAWIPVPGEGGHVDLGPRSDRENEIFPHIERIEGRVSAEQILCGRGLLNLYRAICAADGVAPILTDPAEVSTSGLANENKAAAEAIRLFSTYLGRVAGDMALVFMARGGVYLAGGIPQKILPALKGPEFRAAFEDKAPHSSLMRSTPTFVVTHPLAALAGLSSYARMPGRFGVATEGRRWRK